MKIAAIIYAVTIGIMAAAWFCYGVWAVFIDSKKDKKKDSDNENHLGI